MTTSTFKNSMDFWEDQATRALEDLDSKIQAIIELHSIAEKFSIEDFEKHGEYPIGDFLMYYTLEELYNTGKENSSKSVEASYAKLNKKFKKYQKNGLVEKDREGLVALTREAEERGHDISDFLLILRELADAHPNIFD